MRILNLLCFIVFFVLCCGSTYIATHIYTKNRPIPVKNPFAKFVLFFPLSLYALIKKKKQPIKTDKVSILGIVLPCLNMFFLLSSIVLQFFPAMPCAPIHLNSARHVSFDVTTYNEKIPILGCLILILFNLLLLLGKPFIFMLTDKSFSKKLGKGNCIILAFIDLFLIVMIVFLFVLLLQ